MPLQYEAFQGIYFGYVLRNEPDFEPLTVNGVNRLIPTLFAFDISLEYFSVPMICEEYQFQNSGVFS